MTATPDTPPERSLTIEQVTPAIAAEWLEHNVNNRNHSAAAVANLARLMEEGKWEFNGDPIRFDWLGNLIDGQHRCMGVVTSGVTLQQQVVIRNLPPETQATMDQGRKRTATDVLNMNHHKNGGQIASLARLVHQWKSGMRTQAELGRAALFPLTNAEVLQWADRDERLGEAAFLSITTSMRAIANPKASGALRYLTQEADAAKSDEFFELLQSGAGLEKGHPILVVRNYWQNLKVNGSRQSTAPKFFDAGIRAWNRYNEGGTMSLIVQRLERAIPEMWVPPGKPTTVNHYPPKADEAPARETVTLKMAPEPEAPKPTPVTRRRKVPAAPLERPGGTGSLFAER